MKANDIKAELVRRGITSTSIAKNLGIARPSVSQVISRKKNTSYVREAIAKAIELPVEQVFPENQETKEAGVRLDWSPTRKQILTRERPPQGYQVTSSEAQALSIWLTTP